MCIKTLERKALLLKSLEDDSNFLIKKFLLRETEILAFATSLKKEGIVKFIYEKDFINVKRKITLLDFFKYLNTNPELKDLNTINSYIR